MFKKIRCSHTNTLIRFSCIVMAFLLSVGVVVNKRDDVSALDCPDLKIVFARGSGGERYTSGHYVAFKDALDNKLKTTGLKYEFEDLDYPAVSIDIGEGHLGTLLGAFFGGGDAYDFGDSVHQGTDELVRMINKDGCKNTKYVLGGYSQGAVVLLDSLNQINSDRIIYAATFGDPKVYLPEGAGMVPSACSGEGLSEYRAYVPDCRAYKGILGAREPYRTDEYIGKVGTWCNKGDVLCSSHFNVRDHVSYVEDGLYEDASRYIMSKVGAWFGIENQYTSPHDTAILIDSTGSMSGLINKYKNEALRLAEKTLNAGGRVALYDYRDLGDGYNPVERCNFETCDLELFRQKLNEITLDGGGDEPESLLSASFQVMKQLNWKFGSTKSLVILTDATYHSPDLDGTTFYDVQKLSKQIDPVNFYIVTEDSVADSYRDLAEATDGAVASSVDDLGLLTDTIMERYDSLPRVEEEFEDEIYEEEVLQLTIRRVERGEDGDVKISFERNGDATIVILNDGIIGTTYDKEITITGLKDDIENVITLVPISKMSRGEGVVVKLDKLNGSGKVIEKDVLPTAPGLIIPKTPDTGRR